MTAGAQARALAVAAALLPAGGRAQVVLLGLAEEPGAALVGRVCLDRDADRRCGPGEPGVAGARVLGAGGAVAIADGAGRFHLLELRGRTILPDRTAYGGHAVVAEGLGARRAFELGPAGAAQVHLAVPPPAAAAPPPLVPAAGRGSGPERRPDGRLRWDLGGRTAAGSAVAVGGAWTVAAADGTFSVEVLLSPGENALLAVVVAPGGGGAVHAWTVDLVPRPAGGDLVAPRAPELLAALEVLPRPGGALVVGRAPSGARLRLGGLAPVAAEDGLFAAWVEPGAPVELADGQGRSLAGATLPLAARDGLRAGVALAEVEISFLGEPGVLVTGRGAASARARLRGVALEAGVDLDDRDRDARLADVLRPRHALAIEHALDAERSLAATGDEGAADDRNPGRGRLWARISAERARLVLGGARAGLTASELGRYDRAFHGAKAAGETLLGEVAIEASAFGATAREDLRGNAPPVPAHDVLASTGGAAFWLAHGEVVPGSEALRVEWRDPLTGRLAAGRALVRGEDYELDWVSGRVQLAAPLPSVGAAPSLLTAGPFAAARAVLVADYLHVASGAGAEDLQGGRVAASVGPLRLSGHAANEDRPEGGYRLAGAAARLDLGPHLDLRAEAATSRGALFARGGAAGVSRSADGGYAFVRSDGGGEGAEARALHLEGRGALGPARLEAWWREREAGYSDAEFDEAVAARERGAELSARSGPISGALLLAERRGGAEEEARLSPLEVRHLVARAGYGGERLGIVLEGVHLEREAPRAGEETSAGARASWRVDPALALELSHHQGLRTSGEGRDPTFTGAGATFARGRSALSVRGGWGPTVGPQLLVGGERGGPDEAVYGTFSADPDAPDVLPGGGAGASALGARRRAGGAELFTEQQFARDALGLRASRVFGAALEPLRGLRVSLSGERGERLRLDGSRRSRSVAAGALGLVRGPFRLALRGEVRAEGDDVHAGAGAAAEWLAAPGVALALRGSWLEGTLDGVEALGFEAGLSGAYRTDRLSALASVARLANARPGELRRDGVVARLAGTFSPTARLEAGVGAALAIQELAGARDDRLVGSARARVRIAGPLDAALEYARRAPLRGGDLGALDALRAEVGVTAAESRLAIGYTLLGFGGDGLAPATDTGRLFVRAQVTR